MENVAPFPRTTVWTVILTLRLEGDVTTFTPRLDACTTRMSFTLYPEPTAASVTDEIHESLPLHATDPAALGVLHVYALLSITIISCAPVPEQLTNESESKYLLSIHVGTTV